MFVAKLKFEVVLFVLLRYQGYIGAALVLGGMDCNGPHLYSIYPHGSTDKLPYVTMGQYQRWLTLQAVGTKTIKHLRSGCKEPPLWPL